MMSNVLDFESAPRIVTGRKPIAAGACEVVIFPGVRFERRKEEQLSAKQTDKAKAR